MSNLNRIDDALAYYNRALNMGRTLKVDNSYVNIPYNIGATHLVAGNYEQAIEYFIQAEENFNDSQNRLLLYQKMSINYIELNNYQKANEYLRMAKENVHSSTELSSQYSLEWIESLFTDDLSLQLDLIRKTYMESTKDSHKGFEIFYANYLLDVLKKKHLYKEALLISEKLNFPNN